MAIQHIFNKAKCRTLSLFTENTQLYFRYVQNESIIFRPGTYNLQTRAITFLDQEKLLEK